MSFYRRNLPHWQPGQGEYFVTFRLSGSLPAQAVKQLAEERKRLEESGKDGTIKQRRIFARYEHLLDHSGRGPTWLKRKPVADVVCESIHYRDGTEYDLYAYCVMPNHVHIVLKLLARGKMDEEFPLTKVLHELKRYTASKCNKVLNRKGQFWQHESYDRLIRNNEELENTIRYVLYNPVKAGLTDKWKDWPYSYCKPEYIETFR